MSRASMLIALCLPAALALAAACGGGERAVPSGAELPEGFPLDFPFYEKAVVTVAAEAPEGGRFLVSMDTEGSADEVRAFYETELDKGPWRVENVVEVPEQQTVIVQFASTDGGAESGTVAIARVQEDGEHVTVAVSLSVPRTPTVAPTPG